MGGIRRHGIIRAIATVTTGNPTVTFDLTPYTSALLMWSTSAALTASLQCSDDGGTTWHTFQTLTAAAGGIQTAAVLVYVPTLVRILNNGAGSLLLYAFDANREVST